jgi:hypothetical protein
MAIRAISVDLATVRNTRSAQIARIEQTAQIHACYES